MTGLVFILFFFSGLCGLVNEVLWTRLLSLVMGNTVFATSTVLAAFMGGLALGSVLFGRLADRTPRPLGLYASLEGVLGIYCMILPMLLDGMTPLYRFLYQQFGGTPALLGLAQFFFSGLLILVPSALMGGTLPAVSRFLVGRERQVSSVVGRLYAVNSIGAVLGTVAAGFVLVPTLGLRLTIYIAAIMNLLVGFTAFLFQQKIGHLAPSSQPVPSERWILFVLACSGAAAMIYEVTWARTLALLIGSSVQAFSLMLGGFIAGLALGSLIFSRIADRSGAPRALFGLLQWGVALSALAFIPLIETLPPLVRQVIRQSQGSFAIVQGMNAATIVAVMLIPTTCLGALFPLAVRLYSHTLPSLGRKLGALYAGNTIGAVIGSLAAGFILIPWLGIQKSILVAVLVNAALGTLVQRGKVRLALVPALILLSAGFLIPPWSKVTLSSGPYKYYYENEASAKEELAKDQILYYREGVTGTVAVRQRGGDRSLIISGKVDAGNGVDMPNQLLLGHLPLLLAKTPRDALVIGLGSGVTAASVARYPVERIDLAEISLEVIEASRFFSDINHDILKDKRLNLITQDGRNHLLLTDRLYDVIISEPPNPWMAGLATLFTKEFFELARGRLRPGGVMAQWISAYNTPNTVIRSVIRTYLEVFPYASLWMAEPGDLILIGSQVPVTVDAEAFQKAYGDPAIREDLARAGRPTWSDLVDRRVAGGGILREAAQRAPVHTDDRPFLEYELPKSLHINTWPENAAWLLDLAKKDTGE